MQGVDQNLFICCKCFDKTIDLNDLIREERQQAIKDFAEKVEKKVKAKTRKHECHMGSGMFILEGVVLDTINKLVKESCGGKE